MLYVEEVEERWSRRRIFTVLVVVTVEGMVMRKHNRNSREVRVHGRGLVY